MTDPPRSPTAFEHGTVAFAELQRSVEAVIRGKPEQVRLSLACMLARGHLLIEDNPGTGKTSLAKAIAAAFGGTVRRVQFTPDLLPTDILGVTVFNPSTATFSFRPGPVFANVVVADEINRASPKTQSALLEVMEEHQVTVDGEPRPVPDPFLVVATQNPQDFQGTYPLPEVQLDRFAMRLTLGYAGREAELEVMARGRTPDGSPGAEQVLDPAGFHRLAQVCEQVAVTSPLLNYVADLVEATRTHRDLRLGVSTRGSITLLAVARSYALANGRAYVTADDIKRLAVPVLAHRIAVTADAEIEGLTERAVMEAVVKAVPVPRSRATSDLPA